MKKTLSKQELVSFNEKSLLLKRNCLALLLAYWILLPYECRLKLKIELAWLICLPSLSALWWLCCLLSDSCSCDNSISIWSRGMHLIECFQHLSPETGLQLLKLLLRLWLVEKVRTTNRSILAWHFPVRLIALWHSEEFILSRAFPCYLLDRQHGVYFNCWCSKIGQQLQTDLNALHSAWLFEQGKSTWMKTLSSLPEGERITLPAPAPSLVLVVCQTAAPCGRPLPAWIGSPPHQASFRPVCRLLCHLRFWVLVMPLCFDWSIHPTKPLWDRNLYRTTKSLWYRHPLLLYFVHLDTIRGGPRT